MTPEYIGNIIAFGATLVALVALWDQRQAAIKQLKLQNFIEYTKRYQEIILNFPENINEPTFDIGSLQKQEKDKLMRYMRCYFDLCYEEFTLAAKKILDHDLWKMWEEGIKAALSKSAFQQAWNKIKIDTSYDTKFNKFINELTQKNANQ
jgi:hypothetical protein